MWRKIIEKMYDPKDYEVLEQRFLSLMEEKKQSNKQKLGASKYLSESILQSQMAAGNKKLSREEILQII